MPAPDRLTIPAPAPGWGAVLTDGGDLVAAFGPYPTMGAAAGVCPPAGLPAGQRLEVVPMAAAPSAAPLARPAVRHGDLAQLAARVRAASAARLASWGPQAAG